MSLSFSENDATAVPEKTAAQQGGKCHLRVWHSNELPSIHCDESLTTDVGQINDLTRSLAKVFHSTGCDQYLLPPLSILSKVWDAETEPLYKAFHQLRDYGYMAMVPGCNGDITVSKVY